MGSSCRSGHLCGRGALDQRALGDQRLADASSDGRGHVGVAEVDRGVVLRGLGGGHGGLGLAVRRHGVVVFLLADRIGLDQRRVAIGQHLGAEQIGLRLLELGGGPIVGRLVRRRIDLEEQLLLLDVAALLESDLLDDAGHPRADLRIADRIDTPGSSATIGVRSGWTVMTLTWGMPGFICGARRTPPTSASAHPKEPDLKHV